MLCDTYRLGPCSKDMLDTISANDLHLQGLPTLPDSLIIAMLEREQLLTKVKLHQLSFDRLLKQMRVYHLRRLLKLVSGRPAFLNAHIIYPNPALP